MDLRIIEATKRSAANFNIPEHHALAIVEVESNGRPFVEIDGEPHALIRWEGHYLWRRLPEHLRGKARMQGLAHPSAGGVPNPRGQAERYRILSDAVEFCDIHGIDTDIPYECISIGLGQVMGSHAKSLGYDSAKAMLEAAHDEFFEADAEDQIDMIFKYLDRNNLVDEAVTGDWHRLARGYNGPAYAKHGYHTRLANSAAKWESKLRGGLVNSGLPTIRRGSSQKWLNEKLQTRLVELGYPIGAIDGVFGPQTLAAVVTFQDDNGLVADGIVGPATWARLDDATQPTARRSSERANATTSDLRARGSQSIKWLDRLQGLGVATAGAGGVSVSAAEGLLDQADRVESLVNRASDLLAGNVGLVLLAIGVGVVIVPMILKKIRVEDHRSGKHLGR